ncbi:MAG: AAA family ATPase [Planctomycetaceae bacterium]|nr:AAA family ATPase [Planctomycetaceae bacterium]
MTTLPAVTNTDMEAAVIGAVILEPSTFPVVSAIVKPTDFSNSALKTVFLALMTLYSEGQPLDPCLVVAELRRTGRLDGIGGISTISDLTEAATTGVNAKFYAEKMVAAVRDRRRADAISASMTAIASGKNPTEVCHTLQKQLADLSGDVGKITILDAGVWLQETIPGKPAVIDGLLDIGDKAFLIGGPKTRKSFFVMQLALCLAAGRDFLGFTVPAPIRVAVCQMEIQPHHYHRRLSRLADAKAIDYSLLSNRLYIANLRGVTADLDDITAGLYQFRPEVVILDPMYKLYKEGHDENSAGDAASLLAKFDRLVETLDCALVVVHHDNKRASGDTKATSRGSGSSAVARDYDAALLLTAHATEPDAMVLETIARNHPSRDPVTVLWDVNRFVVADSIVPTPETSGTRLAQSKKGPTDEEIIGMVAEWFGDKPIASTVLQSRIHDTFKIGEKRTLRIIGA